MSPVAALIAGLLVALLIAGAWIAWLWKVRRARFETQEGLTILSAMRWRELSNLVVDALAASGFERETAEQQAERRTAGEVHVYRDGRPWILTCRQGLAHMVTPASVDDFTRGFRTSQAVGGLIVTPGRVEPAARAVASNVELVDGPELWALVGPLLPSSVHAEVDTRARARAFRAAGTAF
ncbi:MAG TPA: restriction endonuclease, partial [Lysobacter sp.]